MVQCLSEWGFFWSPALIRGNTVSGWTKHNYNGKCWKWVLKTDNTSPKVCSLSKCLVVYGFLTGLVAWNFKKSSFKVFLCIIYKDIYVENVNFRLVLTIRFFLPKLLLLLLFLLPLIISILMYSTFFSLMYISCRSTIKIRCFWKFCVILALYKCFRDISWIQWTNLLLAPVHHQ